MAIPTSLPLKRALVAGTAALALGLGAAGIVGAQQVPTPAPSTPAAPAAPAPGDRASCPEDGAGGGAAPLSAPSGRSARGAL